MAKRESILERNPGTLIIQSPVHIKHPHSMVPLIFHNMSSPKNGWFLGWDYCGQVKGDERLRLLASKATRHAAGWRWVEEGGYGGCNFSFPAGIEDFSSRFNDFFRSFGLICV